MMKKFAVFLSSFALLSLVAVPAAALADRGHGHFSVSASTHAESEISDDDIEAESETEIEVRHEREHGDDDDDCERVSPGHLIAPGWLRKHGDIVPTVPDCQILPPGIEDILEGDHHGRGHGHGTSTHPRATTTISGIVLAPTTAAVTVSWTTSRPATSQVLYGTTTAYGSSTTLDSALTTSHSQTITGLSASTTYHFQIQSRDSKGNLVVSSDQSVSTLQLPAISLIVATPSSTSATINWTTNVAAASKVYYSIGTPVDITATSTLVQSDGSLVTSHSLSLIGLTASTTYGFVISSEDAFANTATSSQQFFVTMP